MGKLFDMFAVGVKVFHSHTYPEQISILQNAGKFWDRYGTMKGTEEDFELSTGFLFALEVTRQAMRYSDTFLINGAPALQADGDKCANVFRNGFAVREVGETMNIVPLDRRVIN